MLIVLDDARDAEQVLPLLPGSPSCTVLITSRRRLAGLVTAYGARPLALDVVSEAEARDMLVRRLGAERVAREPQAVAALLGSCAGLPLAISVVAARAGTHPGFPLAALAEELRDRSARLDALGTDDPVADLRAVLSSSYDALDAATARVFGLIGQAPGPDISLAAASALTALPVPRVRSHLRGLEEAHLVQETRPGRYRMHDLVRLYAAERAAQDQPGDALDSALRGLADFYAATAHDGDRLLSPQRTPFGTDLPDVTPGAHPLGTVETALSWFEAEHLCLLDTHRCAMARGHYPQAWQLAWSLDTFHWRQGNLDDRTAMLRATLAAGDSMGDRAQRALAHRLLGRAHAAQGRHEEALADLQVALTLFEEAGDPAGRAQTHLNLALAWEKHGDDRQALAHALKNLRVRRTLHSPPREAEALNAVGWYHARLGHHERSRRYCEEALALCRRHRFREWGGLHPGQSRLPRPPHRRPRPRPRALRAGPGPAPGTRRRLRGSGHPGEDGRRLPRLGPARRGPRGLGTGPVPLPRAAAPRAGRRGRGETGAQRPAGLTRRPSWPATGSIRGGQGSNRGGRGPVPVADGPTKSVAPRRPSA